MLCYRLLIILQKKALRIMSLECRNAYSNPLFFRHEIIKLLHKIIMENCLFISKSINFNLPSILNHWFTFSSDSRNYETISSSKGLLKIKTVKTKKYDREAMINNAMSTWNNIQKIISSPVLRDLSHSKLKWLLLKHFLKSTQIMIKYFNIDLIPLSVLICAFFLVFLFYISL